MRQLHFTKRFCSFIQNTYKICVISSLKRASLRQLTPPSGLQILFEDTFVDCLHIAMTTHVIVASASSLQQTNSRQLAAILLRFVTRQTCTIMTECSRTLRAPLCCAMLGAAPLQQSMIIQPITAQNGC